MAYTTHKNGDWGMVYYCYTNITLIPHMFEACYCHPRNARLPWKSRSWGRQAWDPVLQLELLSHSMGISPEA